MVEAPFIKMLLSILEILGFFIVSVLVYLFKKQDEKIGVFEKEINNIKENQSVREKSNLERCASIHEKEAKKFDNMATKQDVRDLRKDMNDGFENVNNNILSLARGR